MLTAGSIKNCHVYRHCYYSGWWFARLYKHGDVIKWKHPSVDSPHKCQWRGALMFSLVCTWTNGWANNQDAGSFKHHRAYYKVTVMVIQLLERCPKMESDGEICCAADLCGKCMKYFCFRVFLAEVIHHCIILQSWNSVSSESKLNLVWRVHRSASCS